MILTKEKMEDLLQINVDKSNGGLRYKYLKDIFNGYDKYKIVYDYNAIRIDDEQLIHKNGDPVEIRSFGPAYAELTRSTAFSGIEAMADSFDDKYRKTIIDTGNMLGGFENKQMYDEYRIISNTINGKDDFDGSLNSSGLSRHPSSNFADNNYFFNIMLCIKNMKGKLDKISEEDYRNLVLRYFDESYFKQDDDPKFTKEYKAQQEVLKYRFPLKFFWMWANRDKVLHLTSLMAFREFVKSDFFKVTFDEDPKELTNSSIEDFTKKWHLISNKMKEIFSQYDLSKLSKTISYIGTEEVSIKNPKDLLSNGNKAVIFYGPVGTGKTYTSKELVKEVLEIQINENETSDKYIFSKNENKILENHGYYEIVQFHSIYTYEDFMGGISPDLDGENLKYIKKEGIFKRFCDVANDNKGNKYIFIIDEINRADLASVFGELLYALEYRGESVNLPILGNFQIPENVYIIGTMNNVDKSLVTFDLALRRRFSFFKIDPDLDKIGTILETKISDESAYINEENLKDFIEKCEQINKSIVDDLGLDENHKIGQAYFAKIFDFMKNSYKDKEYFIDDFAKEKLWVYNLEPLLEEYLSGGLEDDNIKKKLEEIKNNFLGE